MNRFSRQRAQVLVAMVGCVAVAGFLLARTLGDEPSPSRFTVELVDMTSDNPLPPETTVWIGDEQWSDAMGTREFVIDTMTLVRIAVPEMITFALDRSDPSDLTLIVEDDRVALQLTSGEERSETRANPFQAGRESAEERLDPSGPASFSFGDPPSTPSTLLDEPAASFSFGDPAGPPIDGAASFSFGDQQPALGDSAR